MSNFEAGRIGSGRFDRGDDERSPGEIYSPDLLACLSILLAIKCCKVLSLQSALLNSTKNKRISLEFGQVSNLGLLLTQEVNGVYPEEVVELVEIPEVELRGVDCLQ